MDVVIDYSFNAKYMRLMKLYRIAVRRGDWFTANVMSMELVTRGYL